MNTLIFQIFLKTPWTGVAKDRTIINPLSTQNKRDTITTRMYIHAQTGTEHTIAMFQRFKTVHAGEFILLVLFLLI
jgi:hypothetical protein